MFNEAWKYEYMDPFILAKDYERFGWAVPCDGDTKTTGREEEVSE